jgi:hypothetical protein
MEIHDILQPRITIKEAFANELYKAWYNPDTDDSLNVPLFRTHTDWLKHNPLQFNHADLPTALSDGWCRLGIDEYGTQEPPKIIAFVQAIGSKNALRAARWLRKQDHTDWSLLRVDQGDGRLIEIANQNIDRYLRTGGIPRSRPSA